MDKQIIHDKFHDESKTMTHRLRKLPDDGDLWAPYNLLTLEQKSTDRITYVDAFSTLDFLTLNTLIMPVKPHVSKFCKQQKRDPVPTCFRHLLRWLDTNFC